TSSSVILHRSVIWFFRKSKYRSLDSTSGELESPLLWSTSAQVSITVKLPPGFCSRGGGTGGSFSVSLIDGFGRPGSRLGGVTGFFAFGSGSSVTRITGPMSSRSRWSLFTATWRSYGFMSLAATLSVHSDPFAGSGTSIGPPPTRTSFHQTDAPG